MEAILVGEETTMAGNVHPTMTEDRTATEGPTMIEGHHET
jgi:hypothetical protein